MLYFYICALATYNKQQLKSDEHSSGPEAFKRGAVEPRPVSERGVPYEDTELCGHFRFAMDGRKSLSR